MAQLKLASQPPSEYRNGLLEILRELVDDPSDQRIALVVYDVKRVETDVDREQQVPTVRFLRIEPPTAGDRSAAWGMLERATKARVGDDEGVQQLPFDDEHGA